MGFWAWLFDPLPREERMLADLLYRQALRLAAQRDDVFRLHMPTLRAAADREAAERISVCTYQGGGKRDPQSVALSFERREASINLGTRAVYEAARTVYLAQQVRT